MKLYLGSRDYKPDGFLTVDIDPAHNPDILADVTRMTSVASESVDEICASHILEHLPWPESFVAVAEWARVLRIGGRLRLAVPDLGLLARFVAEGRNAWGAVGLIFGVGRLENPLEAHQYGYTRDMLVEILRSLGFDDFDWWKHDVSDASNGWMLDDAGERIAISLNLAATKVGQPTVEVPALASELMHNRLQPFGQVVARILGSTSEAPPANADSDPVLVQRLHMALIEARMRILYLEDQISSVRGN